jgi:hypothetical protein
MTSVCHYIETAFKQKGMLSAHALLLPEIEVLQLSFFATSKANFPNCGYSSQAAMTSTSLCVATRHHNYRPLLILVRWSGQNAKMRQK